MLNNDSYYYAIIERSYHLCVLETGFGSSEYAWTRANKLHASYPVVIKDYDVMLFASESERVMFLCLQAKPMNIKSPKTDRMVVFA